MLRFARSAAASLSGGPAEVMVDTQRERFMASEALRRHVAGKEALLLCTLGRQSAVQRWLSEPTETDAGSTSRRVGSGAREVMWARIWPLLLILAYVVPR